jgi:hypothetical protein
MTSKLKIYAVTLIFGFLLAFPLIVSAHPGNTAADGMHYCWTNCSYWGVEYGQRHSHGSSSSYSSSYFDYTPTPTASCPLNSYEYGDSCKCYSGYVASNGSCVSGNSYCWSKLGYMSSYDSLSKSCKCDSGYEIGTFGTCTKSINSSYRSYYGSYSPSLFDCPANSHESSTDSTKCTCDAGYKTNSKKTACVALTKTDKNKMCKDTFGPKSQWNGKELDKDGLPTCACKKGYEWGGKDNNTCIKPE